VCHEPGYVERSKPADEWRDVPPMGAGNLGHPGILPYVTGVAAKNPTPNTSATASAQPNRHTATARAVLV